jgi:SSS family solute:Na+ symporter
MIGKLQFIDVSIVVVYLVLCLVIGLYKSTKIKTIKEYAVGNRNFSTFVIISTIFATFVSAGATVGATEAIYRNGLVYALALFCLPLNWLIVRNVYAKNIHLFKDCISISEIMASLYGNLGHNITNVIIVTKSIGFLSIQVTAIGYLFNYFFDFSYVQGVFIGVSILTLYSALGGVRAVALTDVFQFLIFFIALPLACGIAYFKFGGYSKVILSISDVGNNVFDNHNSVLLFLSYSFWVILPAMGAPYAQRLLMAKNNKQILNSYNVLIIAAIFLVMILFFLGMFIRSNYLNIEPKLGLYSFIGNLPPIFIGIMVAGMLAVIMSTADSWLNALSVVISHDVIKKSFPKINSKQEVIIARIVTFLSAGAAVFISLKSKEIFKLIIFLDNFYYPLLFIPYTAGFLRFKTNHISFLSCTIITLLSVFITRLIIGEFGIISMIIGVFSSCIGFFGSHYIQFPSELGVLKDKIVNKIKISR